MSKSRRNNRRSNRRRTRRRRRRRQRGGGCPLLKQSGAGGCPLKQRGGRRRRRRTNRRRRRRTNRRRRRRTNRRHRRRTNRRRRRQRGGGKLAQWMYPIIPSDILDVGFSASNGLKNMYAGYIGEKGVASSSPMAQPIGRDLKIVGANAPQKDLTAVFNP